DAVGAVDPAGMGAAGATAPAGRVEGSSLVETGTATGPGGGSVISGGLWSHGGCSPPRIPEVGTAEVAVRSGAGSGGSRTESEGRAWRYSFARFAASPVIGAERPFGRVRSSAAVSMA